MLCLASSTAVLTLQSSTITPQVLHFIHATITQLNYWILTLHFSYSGHNLDHWRQGCDKWRNPSLVCPLLNLKKEEILRLSINRPGEFPPVCENDVLVGSCPVAVGEKMTIATVLVLSSAFPSVNAEAIWNLLDENSNPVVCFRVTVSLL